MKRGLLTNPINLQYVRYI